MAVCYVISRRGGGEEAVKQEHFANCGPLMAGNLTSRYALCRFLILSPRNCFDAANKNCEGLQIALYDVFKGLFAFLDGTGVNIFAQRLIWGAFAGGTAAVITTPFDILTTNILTAAQDESEVAIRAAGKYDMSSKYRPLGPFEGVGSLFYDTVTEIMAVDGPRALFTGAIPRLLFFGPAAMIFFASYETLFDLFDFFQAKQQAGA